MHTALVPTVSEVFLDASQLTYSIIRGGISGSLPSQRSEPEGVTIDIVELIDPHGAHVLFATESLVKDISSLYEVTPSKVGQFSVQYDVSRLKVPLPLFGMLAMGRPRRAV